MNEELNQESATETPETNTTQDVETTVKHESFMAAPEVQATTRGYA